MATRIKWKDFGAIAESHIGNIEKDVLKSTGVNLSALIEKRKRKRLILERVGLTAKFVATEMGFLPLKNWERSKLA